MSLYEAKWLSKLGHDVQLLIPFPSIQARKEFESQHGITDYDSFEKLGASFSIRPVCPADLPALGPFDVGIWQSYTKEDWEPFFAGFKERCHVLTKNFPKSIPLGDFAENRGVTNQFKAFDFLGFALRDDISQLQGNPVFFDEHAWQIGYAPRGADPEKLRPEESSSVPCIGFDAPVGSDPRATEHIVRALRALRGRYPDLRVLSLNKSYEGIETERVPFGDFRSFYSNFMNPLWVYMTINYRFSPSHLQAAVQQEDPSWANKAIYEVQNVECQMGGACVFGHASNLIRELYVPEKTGFEFPHFSDVDDIVERLSRILSDFPAVSKACRQFALQNHSWETCIRYWEEGLMKVFRDYPEKLRDVSPATVRARDVSSVVSSGAKESDIPELIRLGRKYKWATGEVRRRLERAGINLVRSDFYSESPSLDEIESSFEYRGATGPSDSLPVFDDPAIFDLERISRFAISLIPFGDRFIPATEKVDGAFFWKNSQFSRSDAMALYALLKSRKPATVVEIGSGFSTHVSHTALGELENRRLIAIDPEPRTDISDLDGIEIIGKPIQEFDRSYFQELLQPGDVIFYDGSHSLKTGSDTVYFYLKILPYLPAGVFVHVHDVRLPYPRNMKALTEGKIYWSEQYLLMAHLHNTARYEVLFACDFLQRRRPDILQEMMWGRFVTGGVSMWIRVRESGF